MIYRLLSLVILLLLSDISLAKSQTEASYILDNHFITESETGGHFLTLGSLLLSVEGEGKNNIYKASVLANHGGHSPTWEVGDAQILSNIDTEGVESIKVYELYIGRKKGDSQFTLGWKDLSQSFNVTSPALTFVNSSFGTSAEWGAAGFRGPGIYPFISFGLHFWIQNSSPLYFGGALVDPVSPRYHHPKQLRTHILLNPENHMAVVEGGLHKSDQFQLAAGTWNMKISEYGQLFSKHEQSGTYVQSFVRLGSGWYPFARFGQSSRLVGHIHNNLAFGLSKRGIFFRSDEWGVGHTKALVYGSQTPEEATEMLYQFPLIPGLKVLFSHQLIINPAHARSDAQVFTVRLHLTPKT